MKNKIVLVIFSSLMLNCASVLSYEAEDYVAVLQWDVKWNRVVSSAVQSYVERGKELYPRDFTVAQVDEAAQKIKSALSQDIGWPAMKETVISDYRAECGDDLLDVIVEVYAGAELTEEEKVVVSEDYLSCAAKSVERTMNSLVGLIDGFVEQEQEILSNIRTK